MWVRNEERLNEHCSKVISKDVQAVRSDCTTQEPRRALRITRLLFEILLLCLRRMRLERKSTKNHSEIDENQSQIVPKSTKNRSWAVLGARSCFGDASGRARDGFWTPKCRPKANLGAPWASQERPGAIQKRPRASPKTLQDPPGEPSERQWCTERLRTRLRIDFWSLLSCRTKAPMCLAHQFLWCFAGFARN